MQPPSPELIFATMNAFHRSAALKSALELDVFTAIAEGNGSADSLARRCGAARRGIRILCDYLVMCGLLTKTGEQYGLTPDSAVFLDRRSPAYIGAAIQFLNSPQLVEAFGSLTESVRKGGTAWSGGEFVAPEHPIWVNFAHSMAPLMRPPAETIAGLVNGAAPGPLKVLDIAAGHGLFGIAIAAQNPGARVVAVDWPQVLEVALANARAAGIDGRYATIPGSAFEVVFGEGYDVALLTNFLHHFDPPTCRTLLEKVRRALSPGGRAVTLEFVPNEDRVSPPAAAGFSLLMLATTEAGDAYTYREYDEMFRSAGFGRTQVHSIPGYPSQILVSYRA